MFPPVSWSSSTSTSILPSGTISAKLRLSSDRVPRARTRRHNHNYNRKKEVGERGREREVNAKEGSGDGKIELSVIVQPEQEESPAKEIETVGTVENSREENKSRINWCCW